MFALSTLIILLVASPQLSDALSERGNGAAWYASYTHLDHTQQSERVQDA